MTDWNEDNFLEKLLAQVRQQGGAKRDPCPDAETLLAVLEGEAPAPLREQVTEHLKHCQDCAELQSRLLNFEAEASPEPEAVWKETRKRLDNWLEGFLRSEAAKLRAAKSTAPSHKGARWETFWRPFISWKVVWGLGAVALLVLIADGVLVMELRRGRPRQAEVAARTAVSQKQPANAQPQVAEHPLVGAPLVGALTNRERAQQQAARHPLVGTRGKQEHGLPQVAAPSPPSPEVGNVPSQPMQAAAQPPPSPASNAAAAPQAVPEVGKAGTSGALSTALVAQSSRSSSSGAANAAAAVAAEHPPSLHLEVGAHLLLALSSVKPRPDGTLQFRGTLLLPVLHDGPVPLDRGAEVIGVMTTSQGQTALAVVEFVTQGARYTLKAGSGAMKAQTPGAGGAVQLDRSQVLEMWPASPSVYEKSPDTAAQPEPPK